VQEGSETSEDVAAALLSQMLPQHAVWVLSKASAPLRPARPREPCTAAPCAVAPARSALMSRVIDDW
jgi:hypothetical protein